jgi:hypothetical protein
VNGGKDLCDKQRATRWIVEIAGGNLREVAGPTAPLSIGWHFDIMAAQILG